MNSRLAYTACEEPVSVEQASAMVEMSCEVFCLLSSGTNKGIIDMY